MERGDGIAPVPTMGERVNAMEAETETSRCQPPANVMRSPGKLPRFCYIFNKEGQKGGREEKKAAQRWEKYVDCYLAKAIGGAANHGLELYLQRENAFWKSNTRPSLEMIRRQGVH